MVAEEYGCGSILLTVLRKPPNASIRFLRPFLWSVLLGLSLYGISVVATDLQAVGSAMVKLGMAGWGIILGLSLVNYGLRFMRWQGFLVRLGYRVPVVPSLAYYLGGFAFTTTPGKAGEAIRSLYLKRRGVTYVHSLAALFAERFIDLVAMVILALSAAWAYSAARWPVLLLSVVILAVLPLAHHSGVHRWLDKRLVQLSSQRVKTLGSHFLDLLRSSAKLMRSTPLYLGLILGLAAWGAEGIAFHVILESLDIPVGLGLAIGIYAVSVLAGALSFIPGGLGSTEAVMGLLLMLSGADTATAVAATLICRIATLWFAVAIGLLVIAVLETRTACDSSSVN